MNMGSIMQYPRPAMVQAVTMTKFSHGEFEHRVNTMRAKTQELIDSGMYRGEAAARLLDAAEVMRDTLTLLQAHQTAIFNASTTLYDRVIDAEARRAVDASIQQNLIGLRDKSKTPKSEKV